MVEFCLSGRANTEILIAGGGITEHVKKTTSTLGDWRPTDAPFSGKYRFPWWRTFIVWVVFDSRERSPVLLLLNQGIADGQFGIGSRLASDWHGERLLCMGWDGDGANIL